MVENLDPNKYHVMSKGGKRVFILVLLFVILIVIPPILYGYYNFAINRPSQTENEVTIEIEKGESVYGIAGRLYEQNVLNSKYLFSLYVLSTNRDKSIQAGIYIIPSGISIVELTELLQYGTNDQKTTLIEGWRVEEYARELTDRFENVDYESFIRIAKPFEGYLFPDTYEFRKDVIEKDIVDVMRENFDSKTSEILNAQALGSLGLSKKEVVILASIVEREVTEESDKAVVAGILIKRYLRGDLLGADATTQYIAAFLREGCDPSSEDVCPPDDFADSVEWWPNNLLQTELEYNNPYNTRKVPGLPPAPICNPGLESIAAVIKSVPTQYNYYLTDKNGITHYAVTLEEHNANINMYLR